jgi:hypothetical protein
MGVNLKEIFGNKLQKLRELSLYLTHSFMFLNVGMGMRDAGKSDLVKNWGSQ